MKRMATLASLTAMQGGELQANIAKYKEESEKEDISEVRCVTSASELVLNAKLTGSPCAKPRYRGDGEWGAAYLWHRFSDEESVGDRCLSHSSNDPRVIGNCTLIRFFTDIVGAVETQSSLVVYLLLFCSLFVGG
jgi:hypothetical protein